jgi:hypothetical protein
MADILDEVLRDQSDEKKLYFFKKILPFIIGFTVLIVICMIINNWYQDKKSKENMELGDILIKSLNNPDKKTTDEVLSELAKNHPDNKVSEIAMLKRVGILVESSEIVKAKALLEEIVNSKHSGSTTKSFARVAWLSLVIDQPQMTEKEKDIFQEYLKYYTDDSQEFFGTASLLKAIWFEKNNQNELAKEVLIALKSASNIPAIIKEQARALLAKLELKN